MADNHDRAPGDPPGPNINRVGDGARTELDPSVDLEQRFGRGVRKGDTPDTVTLFYYFAGSSSVTADGALERTN